MSEHTVGIDKSHARTFLGFGYDPLTDSSQVATLGSDALPEFHVSADLGTHQPILNDLTMIHAVWWS